jgi:uncharacterized protein
MSFQDRFQSGWTSDYIKKFLHLIAIGLVILGGINFLLIGIMEMNLLTTVFGDGFFCRFLYFLIGLSALSMILNRDTYLPFLGPMVAPCSVLQNQEPPGATKSVKVIVPPHSKLLYWAAEPKNEDLKKVQTWSDAYLKYDNAGVTTSNADGVAILKVRAPQPYLVPLKGKLDSHVHYRVCGEAGWMGRVHTVFIKQEPEGFESEKRERNWADSSASIY